MHAEKTEVMARAKSRHHQLLLRLGRSRLLQDLRNLIQSLPARHKVAPDRSIVRQLALMGRLHRRHRTIFGPGNLHELLRATLRRATDVKMISYQQQKRLAPDKLLRTANRVTVPERRFLLDE